MQVTLPRIRDLASLRTIQRVQVTSRHRKSMKSNYVAPPALPGNVRMYPLPDLTFEISRERVESITFNHETSPLYIPVTDIFLHYVPPNKHYQDIQSVFTRTCGHFFPLFLHPTPLTPIPRIERLGYRSTRC